MNRDEPKRPRVVFCRVGWMRFYSLWPEDDGPIGGGAYNDDGPGGEVSNFRELEGRYFGYVQAGTGGETGLNLRRIEPSIERGTEELDGVLVVLVAKRPEEGGQVVVGWYADATCQAAMTWRRRRPYVWSADPARAVLLPERGRTIAIPKGKGGMGQSNVAYAHDADGVPHEGAWIDEALDQISAYSGPNLVGGAAYNELDDLTEHRAKKEREMLDHVIENGVRPLWRGAEITRAALGEPYDLLARRGSDVERILVRVSEAPWTHVDFTAEELRAIAESPVPYALLAISSLKVHVRNGEFVFAGGTIKRESPFRPQPDRLAPVVLRYSWQ